MKYKMLYAVSAIVIVLPWLFLLEAIPISYANISTAVEVTAEGLMFAALLAIVILLNRELKRMKSGSGEGMKSYRVIGRILFVLASVTLFVVGLILALIAISFSLL